MRFISRFAVDLMIRRVKSTCCSIRLDIWKFANPHKSLTWRRDRESIINALIAEHNTQNLLPIRKLSNPPQHFQLPRIPKKVIQQFFCTSSISISQVNTLIEQHTLFMLFCIRQNNYKAINVSNLIRNRRQNLSKYLVALWSWLANIRGPRNFIEVCPRGDISFKSHNSPRFLLLFFSSATCCASRDVLRFHVYKRSYI